jgi:hypothetical protein
MDKRIKRRIIGYPVYSGIFDDLLDIDFEQGYINFPQKHRIPKLFHRKKSMYIPYELCLCIFNEDTEIGYKSKYFYIFVRNNKLLMSIFKDYSIRNNPTIDQIDNTQYSISKIDYTFNFNINDDFTVDIFDLTHKKIEPLVKIIIKQDWRMCTKGASIVYVKNTNYYYLSLNSSIVEPDNKHISLDDFLNIYKQNNLHCYKHITFNSLLPLFTTLVSAEYINAKYFYFAEKFRVFKYTDQSIFVIIYTIGDYIELIYRDQYYVGKDTFMIQISFINYFSMFKVDSIPSLDFSETDDIQSYDIDLNLGNFTYSKSRCQLRYCLDGSLSIDFADRKIIHDGYIYSFTNLFCTHYTDVVIEYYLLSSRLIVFNNSGVTGNYPIKLVRDTDTQRVVFCDPDMYAIVEVQDSYLSTLIRHQVTNYIELTSVNNNIVTVNGSAYVNKRLVNNYTLPSDTSILKISATEVSLYVENMQCVIPIRTTDIPEFHFLNRSTYTYMYIEEKKLCIIIYGNSYTFKTNSTEEFSNKIILEKFSDSCNILTIYQNSKICYEFVDSIDINILKPVTMYQTNEVYITAGTMHCIDFGKHKYYFRQLQTLQTMQVVQSMRSGTNVFKLNNLPFLVNQSDVMYEFYEFYPFSVLDGSILISECIKHLEIYYTFSKIVDGLEVDKWYLYSNNRYLCKYNKYNDARTRTFMLFDAGLIYSNCIYTISSDNVSSNDINTKLVYTDLMPYAELNTLNIANIVWSFNKYLKAKINSDTFTFIPFDSCISDTDIFRRYEIFTADISIASNNYFFDFNNNIYICTDKAILTLAEDSYQIIYSKNHEKLKISDYMYANKRYCNGNNITKKENLIEYNKPSYISDFFAISMLNIYKVANKYYLTDYSVSGPNPYNIFVFSDLVVPVMDLDPSTYANIFTNSTLLASINFEDKKITIPGICDNITFLYIEFVSRGINPFSIEYQLQGTDDIYSLSG